MRNSSKLFVVLLLAVFFQVSVAAPAHAGFLGSIGSAISGAVSGVVNTVKSTVSSVVGSVTGAVGGVVDAVKGGFSSVVDGFKSGGISGAIGGFTKGISGVIDSVKSGVSSVFGSIAGAGSNIYDTIKNTVKDLIGGGGLGKIVQQVGGDVQKAVSGVTDIAKSVTGGGGKLSELLGKLKDAGLGNLAESVQSGIDNVSKFVKGGADKAGEFLKMVQDVNSEFKKYNLPEFNLLEEAKKLGAENPILKNVTDLAKNLAGDAKKIASTITEKISSSKDGIEGFFKTVTEAAGQYKGDAAKIVADKLKDLTGLRADPKTFNQTFGNIFNTKSTSGGVTTANSMSMGGFKFFTGADDKGAAENAISTHKLLLKGEATLGPTINSSISGSYLGGKGKVSLDNRFVAGLDGQIEGNAKWLTDGALVDAKAKASVTAGLHNTTTFKNNIDLGGGYGNNTTVVVDAMAGAQAKANGTLYAGKNGLEVQGGAEARVGLWADAKGSTSMQYKGQNLFTAEGSAGAGLGVGAGAKGGVSFRADKVGFSAQITLGPVKLGGGLYVNPVAMTEMALDKSKQALTAVGNGLNKVGDGAKKLWDKLF